METGAQIHKWFVYRCLRVKAQLYVGSAPRRVNTLQGDDECQRQIGHHVIVRGLLLLAVPKGLKRLGVHLDELRRVPGVHFEPAAFAGCRPDHVRGTGLGPAAGTHP